MGLVRELRSCTIGGELWLLGSISSAPIVAIEIPSSPTLKCRIHQFRYE